MTQNFELSDPEHQPVSAESLVTLYGRALQIIDARGEPVPVVNPEQDNPNIRSYVFSEEAVSEAGYDEGTTVQINDQPTYVLEGVRRPTLLTVWIEKEDPGLYFRRELEVQLEQDGSFTALPPMEEYAEPGAESSEESPPLDHEEVVRILRERAAEMQHDIFSQAECDQLLALIDIETAGRA